MGITSNLNYLHFFSISATFIYSRGHYVRTVWINQMFAKHTNSAPQMNWHC